MKPIFRTFLAGALLAGACIGMAACNSSAPPPVVQTPASPPDPASLGVSAGPLGAKLTEADRLAAGQAQVSAIESGQRKSWRGKQGAFGFVEPGAEAQRSEGLCRDYSHTIYIDGRPQNGKGLACKGQSGAWRILS